MSETSRELLGVIAELNAAMKKRGTGPASYAKFGLSKLPTRPAWGQAETASQGRSHAQAARSAGTVRRARLLR